MACPTKNLKPEGRLVPPALMPRVLESNSLKRALVRLRWPSPWAKGDNTSLFRTGLQQITNDAPSGSTYAPSFDLDAVDD